jgi:hypothetical protein
LPPYLTTIKISSRPCSVPVRQINAGGSSGIDPYSQRGPEKNSSTAPDQQEQSDEASIPHLTSPLSHQFVEDMARSDAPIIVIIWADDIVAGVTVFMRKENYSSFFCRIIAGARSLFGPR